jgi:hypothetical protein
MTTSPSDLSDDAAKQARIEEHRQTINKLPGILTEDTVALILITMKADGSATFDSLAEPHIYEFWQTLGNKLGAVMTEVQGSGPSHTSATRAVVVENGEVVGEVEVSDTKS